MLYCRRCGQPRYEKHSITGQYYCVHTEGVGTTKNGAHAIRIRAAYQLGKLYNPYHDTTDYAAQAVLRKPSSPRGRTDAGPSPSSAAFTATVGGVMVAGRPLDEENKPPNLIITKD